MIGRLILRDRAMRGLLFWLPLAVLIGLLLATTQQDAVRHGLTVGAHGFQGFRHVALVPWGAIGLYLFFAGIDVRCERSHVALPLSYRALWLSRVLALVLSAWALVGAMAAALLVRNRIQGFDIVGRSRVGSLFAQLLAVSVLAVVLARLPRSELYRLARRPSTVLYLVLGWCGLWGIVFLLAGSAPGYALLPGIAAVVLAVWVYLSLPAVPTLAAGGLRDASAAASHTGSEKTDSGEAAAVDRLVSESSSRWLVPVTIWRTCYGQSTTWIVLALLLLLLVMVARADADSGLYGPSLFVTFWLVLSVLFALSASKLHVLDALPISRKRIFVHLTLPGLLVLLLGYVGATALRAARLSRESPVEYSRHPIVGDVDVRVPLAYWEIDWQGETAPLDEPYVPPWEEPYTPWSIRLYKGLPVVLYSPYHLPEDSSPDRVARQLGRAVEDVYGVRIPPDELERRYLQTATDGSAARRSVERFLLDDYPDLRRTLWRRILPLEVLLSSLPWLLYLALTVRGGFVRPASERKPWGPLAIVALWAVCLLGRLWSTSAGHTTARKLNAFYDILARKVSSALPGGTLAWWGLVVFLYVSVYLWVQSRFERVEVPAQSPSSPTLA